MSIETILRCRAASYMRTSTVVMSEQEYRNFLTNTINHNYPNLRKFNFELWRYLTFVPDSDLPELTDPYEWWLTTPVGPKSCSRDIGDVRELLREWVDNVRLRKEGDRILKVGKGDEWDTDIEIAVLELQRYYPDILVPTGYVDCETIRRLRMQE